MRLDPNLESSNVEDRRGAAPPGGGGRFRGGRASLGIGGIVVVIVLLLMVSSPSRSSASSTGNRASVRPTLPTLEAGDVEEGLAAASAIGDDTIQRRTRGYVVPESFTHGSSADRVRWFHVGLRDGRLESCDTFAAGTRLRER